MKKNNAIEKIDEGWFRNWMDSQTGGEYSRLKGPDANEIKNPKVIEQVALTGFNDYVRRLRIEGIELGKSSSVLANEDRIKDSLIEYVQSYMTSRENTDIVNEILISLKNLSDNFRSLSPKDININSVKKFFIDTAKKRAETIFRLQNQLSSSNKLPAIANMASLISNIPENHEIVFATSLTTWSKPADQAWAFIRKDGVFLTKLPDAIKSAVEAGTINVPAKVRITQKNRTFDVYQVKSSRYLNQIYDEWKNYVGGVIPPTLNGYTQPIEAEL